MGRRVAEPLWLVVSVVLLVLAVLLALLAAVGSGRPAPVGGGAETPATPCPIPPDAPRGLQVFGVGLNKTGTSSLGRFLRSAGFLLFEDPSARRIRAAQNGAVPITSGFGAFEDWPWPLLYAEIAGQLPGARFVLTVRDTPGEWFDSLRRHAARTGPTDQRELVYGHKCPSADNKGDHVQKYREHNRAVVSFFEGTGRLLVLPTSLSDADKSARLADFLAMPRLKGLKYPVANKGRAATAPRGPRPPPPGWPRSALRELRGAGVTGGMLKNLRRYGYLVPVTDTIEQSVSVRFVPGRRYSVDQVERAIVDDTRVSAVPRFVHVPKTGGTFIIYRYVVNNLSHKRGVPASVMVCRQPADRIRSAYRFMRQARSFWHSDDGKAPYGKHPLSEWCKAHPFSEFVAALCVAGTLSDRILWPQADFSPDGVDHLVRFESMDSDLQKLEAAGVLRPSKYPPPAGARNVSKGEGVVVSEDDVRRIEAFYSDDYARFGYPLSSPADSPLATAVRVASDLKDALGYRDMGELPGGTSAETLPGVALVAARKGRACALRLLLDAKVLPNTATVLGTTLLHLAAYHGHLTTARIIVEAGGDTGALNEWGETPAQSAKMHPHMRKLLSP